MSEELYFRLGEAEGFTSKKLADKKDGYATPIRELVQNSLDASKDKKCEVDIYIDSIKTSHIPHIVAYANTLNRSIEFHKKNKSYGHNSEQTVDFIKSALKKDKLDILMFVDNGTGMTSEVLNGLIGERSIKSDESSGGSFGIGHLSSYFLSSLRYVLYASKYKDGDTIKNLFSGSPILAGFADEKGAERGSTGRILAKIPRDETRPEFSFPTIYPDFIAKKMNSLDTGAMVAILGLKTEWDKETDYAIASNFFYAIKDKKLSIRINDNNSLVGIDESNIETILEKNKDGKVARDDKILANQYIYQSWLSVKNDEYKQNIELGNGDKVCVHIRNKIETESAVILIRNGMLIARHDKMLSNDFNNLRKDEGFEPFSIVINVDDKDCPKLFELVKGAESPYHDKLEKDRLTLSKEKDLKKILSELSEKIKAEYLEKRKRDGFNLSIPLLEIPDKAEVQGASTSPPRSQTPKAQPIKPKPVQPKPVPPNINSEGKGKKRKAPVITSRTLESKNAFKQKDNGDTLDIIMSIEPQKMDKRDDVYFSVSLAMDTDNDSADSALDIIKLSIDEKDIPIPDFVDIKEDGKTQRVPADKSQIKIGKLSESVSYEVVATVEKPERVKNISVALQPFLGLRQGSKE